MSSHEALSVPAHDVPAQDDCWRVLLLTGEVRAMSLDELDEAFQAGLIDAETPLLPPGESMWTRVGVAAGLDEPESVEEGTLVQRHTLILANAAARAAEAAEAAKSVQVQVEAAKSVEPAIVPRAPVSTYRTRRPASNALSAIATKRGFAVLAAGVLVLSFGISSAARFALHRSAAKATTSIRAAVVLAMPTSELAAAPAAPPKVADNHVAAAEPKASDSEPSAQAPRDAQKRREAPARARRHVAGRAPSRGPFLSGGDKFDPLNGTIERPR